jgi:hypothetical protein
MRNSVGQSRGSKPRRHRCIHSTESLIVLITSQGKAMPLVKMLRLITQEGDHLTERRADFGFSEGARTILVDCTTLAKSSKITSQAKLRTLRQSGKEKYYQRFLDIKTTGTMCDILLRNIKPTQTTKTYKMTFHHHHVIVCVMAYVG